MKTNEHTPLFLKDILALLKKQKAKKVIDATFGSGGHSFPLEKQGCEVLALEWDEKMFARGQEQIRQTHSAITLCCKNYAEIKEVACDQNFTLVDAVIFDLGLSLWQLRYGQRGFSFERDEKLDLRINSTLPKTAAELINDWNEEELIDYFTKYIEDQRSYQLAELTVREKKQKSISTVGDLWQLIHKLSLSNQEETKLMRKTLQGLRMIVNQEKQNLKHGLAGSLAILRPAGLLLMITFHSLEDRLVKLNFKNNKNIKLKQKPIQNRTYKFARGAKFRIYEKTS